MEEIKKITKEKFTCTGRIEIVDTPVTIKNEKGTRTETEKTYRIVAMIGDRFMNGGFFPAKELKRVHKGWEGTLHDINHFGTNYPAGFWSTSNILFFIGSHKNVHYNSATKELIMDIKINPAAMYAPAWKAYVDICDKAGLIPNVSVTYMGKQEWFLTKNLPKEANWKAEGYGKDDLVPVLLEVEPVCVSTVFRGRCNDKDGCGIRGSCSCNEQNNMIALEKRRQEIIDYLKK